MICLLKHKDVRGHTWGKLFRSSVCLRFRNRPGQLMAQDLLYCAEIFANAKRMVLITDVVYAHRLRASSVKGRKYLTGAYLHWLDSVDRCEAFCHGSSSRLWYAGLQAKTLLQIIGEADALRVEHKKRVLSEVMVWCGRWALDSPRKLFAMILHPALLFRVLKLRYKVRRISAM